MPTLAKRTPAGNVVQTLSENRPGRPRQGRTRFQTYLIYDDGTRDIRVDRLTDDYLASTKYSVIAMPRRHEAPAMVKYRGKYIVAGSGVVGWDPSETHYVVADSPMGPYGPKKCMSSGNTWNSQLTSLVYVRESDLIFAMCDCWWNPDKDSSEE